MFFVFFFFNLLFSFLVVAKVKKEKSRISLIFTRVFLVSVLLSVFKLNHILEIHQECTGVTKKIFHLFYSLSNGKYLKLIYINKNLKKYFPMLKKNNYLILDDAVDVKDFKFKNKRINNSCVYTGSLSPGKGFEIILKLSKLLKSTKFYVYGDLNLLPTNLIKSKISKNIILKDFVTYNKIPAILKANKILLMPYLKKSVGRSGNLNLSNYMSPLKLFDYLAAGRVIIASDLYVYSHILKHKYNCFKFSDLDLKSWSVQIKKVLNNYSIYKSIRENALKTSLKFSWENRVNSILKLNEKR